MIFWQGYLVQGKTYVMQLWILYISSKRCLKSAVEIKDLLRIFQYLLWFFHAIKRNISFKMINCSRKCHKNMKLNRFATIILEKGTYFTDIWIIFYYLMTTDFFLSKHKSSINNQQLTINSKKYFMGVIFLL